MSAVRDALLQSPRLAASLPSWAETSVRSGSVAALSHEAALLPSGPAGAVPLDLCAVGLRAQLLRRRSELAALRAQAVRQSEALQAARARHAEAVARLRTARRRLDASTRQLADRSALAATLRRLEPRQRLDPAQARGELAALQASLASASPRLTTARARTIAALLALADAAAALRAGV